MVAGGNQGFVDGFGTEARFSSPFGLSCDALSGSIFIADAGNHAIRKMSLYSFEVNTLYRFETLGFPSVVPYAIAWYSGNKTMYILDKMNSSVFQIRGG